MSTPLLGVVRAMSPTMLRTLQLVASGRRVSNQARIRDLFNRGLITVVHKDSKMVPELLTELGSAVLNYKEKK
ncbi:hypothetical protein [Corynebacterium flavescens]|uniref:hypothetical protein n=1 Tax=Corynebacterium flavescens TaxID=28028 RepID=UPI003FD1D9A3